MKMWKTILAAAALALASGSAAFAARTDLVLGIPLEPPHLDPTAGAAAAIDEIVYANVFEGLTRIGARGEVLPDLAESWTVSDDGKVYTFKLHTGVKFHDGTRLQRRRREVLARPRARRQFDQRAKGPVRGDRHGRGRRSRDRQGDAEEPARLLPLQSGLGRCGDRRAGDRRNQQGQAGRHRPVQVRPLDQGLGDHHRQGRRLLGRPGVPRQGRVPHRAGRGGRRSGAAVGRRAGLPVLSAGRRRADPGRPALQGGDRLDRRRNDPVDQQQEAALRQSQGAPGDRPRARPQGDHRRRRRAGFGTPIGSHFSPPTRPMST